MADIKNKNELKRRTELFLDEFSHEEYVANEEFCKETMQMMREFIGHTSHRLDCENGKNAKLQREIQTLKNGACTNNCKHYDASIEFVRNKAIEEFAERLITNADSFQAEVNGFRADLMTHDYFMEFVDEIAESMKGEKE